MSEQNQSYLISPYRPPTSYPVTLSSGEAAAWLSAYTALWHPTVVLLTSKPPEPASSYDHDEPRSKAIYAKPASPSLYQPGDWDQRLQTAQAIAFEATAQRDETVANLLTALKNAGYETNDVPREIFRLFSAVGFAYLTIETWYDAASHEHLLDQVAFWSEVQSAAKNVSDESLVRQHLKKACDLLQSARETIHYGSVRLFDFVIVDPENNQPWPASLSRNIPLNVIATGRQLEVLAQQDDGRWKELFEAIGGSAARPEPNLANQSENSPAKVEFCVGVYQDRHDELLPIESQIWNWQKARETVHKLIGQSPRVYARQRSASHIHLPSMLKHAGFSYAVAVSFEGETQPHHRGSAIQWPGADGISVDAYAKEPLPADDSQSFFNLAYHLYQAGTQESNATISFVHKGLQSAAEYDDLLALSELSTVLGEWFLIGQFLSDVGTGDYCGVANPDDFTIDSLDHRVTKKQSTTPISGFVNHIKRRRKLDSVYTLSALHRSLTLPTESDQAFDQTVAQVELAIESVGPDDSSNPGSSLKHREIESQLAEYETSAATRLAQRIQQRSEAGKPGYLVLNTCNFTRRVALELPAFAQPIPIEGVVKAAQFDADQTRLVVEVPSFGFAWIPRAGVSATSPAKLKFKTADVNVVRNEFLEVEFDQATGGIRAIRDLRTQQTRLGIIPVFHPGCKTKCTGMKVTHSGTALGEIISEGELVSEMNEPLAKFSLRARAWVGRPVIELRCTWNITHRPIGFPWHAYYGLRFGTRDERVSVARGINGCSYLANTGKISSPDFLEFRLGRERTFVFTGGQAFMNRVTPKTYDLIQVCEHETETQFDCLLSLDRDVPMQTAISWITPTPVVKTEQGPPSVGTSSWLAQIDSPALVVSSMKPVLPSSESSNRAVLMRMMESSNYATTAELRFARDPSRAFRMSCEGVDQEITMQGDAVPISVSTGEITAIQAEWC
jgi:hypothetical protein